MAFKLIHISDLHIGPLPSLPWRSLLNKRMTGLLNWQSRKSIHNMDVLRCLMVDMMRHQPHHVAITGDLVNLGHEQEFKQAYEIINKITDIDKISVIPGNHDTYTPTSLVQMARFFHPFMQNKALETHETSQMARMGEKIQEKEAPTPISFPYCHRLGKIALIGVNSGIDTLPFMATGEVGQEQAERLARILDETGEAGLFRIVMIHHPLLPKTALYTRRLKDAAEISELIAWHGAELVLHGHNHRYQVHLLEGKIPVIGVASASAVPGSARHLAEYHLFEIEPEQKKITLNRWVYQMKEKLFEKAESSVWGG